MFDSYPDRVKPEPTPERVMAMLRILERGPMTKEALHEAITLASVFRGDASSVYNPLYSAVRQLGLVLETDGKVQLAVPGESFACSVPLRRTIANIIFRKSDSTFFLISQRFLALNQDVLSIQKWEEMSQRLSTEHYQFREEDLLGWRWWAGFLGLGYLVGTTLIPNLNHRLADMLTVSQFTHQENVPMEDFVAHLESWCLETAASRRERTLGLGVSNGLRLLAGRGVLEFRNQRDTERWNLFHVETHPINEVTHITYRG